MTKKLISAAFAVVAGFAVATAQAACVDDWKECAGQALGGRRRDGHPDGKHLVAAPDLG